MATIHIPETEAARDFAAVMAHVEEGSEVVIERDARPVAIIHPPVKRPGMLLSEAIALAEARGSTVTPDGGFADDLRAAIESHRELNSLPPHRTIEECIALLPADSTATIDEDFARDVAAAVAAHREPLNQSAWD